MGQGLNVAEGTSKRAGTRWVGTIAGERALGPCSIRFRSGFPARINK